MEKEIYYAKRLRNTVFKAKIWGLGAGARASKTSVQKVHAAVSRRQLLYATP